MSDFSHDVGWAMLTMIVAISVGIAFGNVGAGVLAFIAMIILGRFDARRNRANRIRAEELAQAKAKRKLQG